MSSGRDQNQRVYQLSDLLELLKENKLSEIMYALHCDRSWTFSSEPGSRIEESADLVNFATKEAILAGNIEAATVFFDAGVYINGDAYKHANHTPSTTVTFLEAAISTGNLDMVKLLVERNATVKQKNSNGNNFAGRAIAAAIKKGNAEVANYLFLKGADANESYNSDRRMDGMSYLAHAARLGHTELAEVILRHASSDCVYAAIYSAQKSYVGDSVFSSDKSRFKSMADNLARNYSDAERKEKLEYASRWESSKKELEEFDAAKADLLERLPRERTEYETTIKNLLDLAPGHDFYDDEERPKSSYYHKSFGLTFLKEVRSVAGFNFVGVSLNGKPITREMLKAMKLEGVDDAVFTLNDIYEKVTDVTRRHALLSRVDKLMNARIGHNQIEAAKRKAVINLVPLAVAAEFGDLETVKIRLAAKINPNEQYGGSVTRAKCPIVEAARNGHAQVVHVLVNHPQIDVRTLSEAIREAQEKGHQEIAEIISQHQDVNEMDKEGNSLLYYAVEKGDVDLVTKLIERGADVNLKSKKGYPLITAVEKIYRDDERYHQRSEPSKPHLEIMHLLLAKGADPNLREQYVGTALDQAGQSACMEAFNTLLTLTTLNDMVYPEYDDRYKKNYPWYTKIMHDAYERAGASSSEFRRNEWKQLMRVLKDKGADIDLHSYYRGTLLNDVMRDFPSYSRVIDAKRSFASYMGGYPKDAEYRRREKESLRDALYSSQKAFLIQLETLDFLLDLGADPALKFDENETTALHGLMDSVGLSHIPGGYARVIDRCIRKGFDINTADKNGFTLLHIAASNGMEVATKYLLSRGANTNLRNKDGRTPLHFAAGRGFHGSCPAIVKQLIQHGADATIKDAANHTPAEYAVEQQNEWINSASFKSWDYATQNDWKNEYNTSLMYLANTQQFRLIPKASVSDEEFIRRLKAVGVVEPSLEAIVGSRELPEEELNLFALYRDDVTGKCMTNPVRLHEGVFDLDTLLATVHDGKGRNPVNGVEFSLADIETAEDVRKDMIELCEYFKEKFSEPKKTEKTSKSLFSKISSMFGGSKTETAPETEQKKVRMG